MYPLFKREKSCQICKKSFANGKALGGHMRSHYQIQSALSRRSEPSAESSTGSIIPLLQTSNKLGANSSPRKTTLTNFVLSSKVVDGPKSSDLSKEGDNGRIFVDLDKVDSIESQCCLIDIETALCLVDMSKKTWPKTCPKKAVMGRLASTQKRKRTEKCIEVDYENDEQAKYYKYLDEDEDKKDEDVNKFPTSNVRILTQENDEDTETDGDEDEDEDKDCTYLVEREQKREYMCDICGKVLSSYQALGGHRTSHRNKRLKIFNKNHQAAQNRALVRRYFECQICGRGFESGQALGGHKKVHSSYS